MAQALPEKRFTRSQMTRQRRKYQTWRAGYRAAYWTLPPPPPPRLSDKEFADALLTEAHTLPPPPPGLFLVHGRDDDLRTEASILEYEVVDDSQFPDAPELEYELVSALSEESDEEEDEVEDIQFRRPFRPKQGDLSRDVSELDGTDSATSTPVRSLNNSATVAPMAPPLPQTQLGDENAASNFEFEFSDLCRLLHQMSWKYYVFKQWNDLSEESDEEDDEVEDIHCRWSKQGDWSRDVRELDGTASATSTPVWSQISLNNGAGATIASMAPPLPQTQLGEENAASKFEFSDLCGLLHQMSWKYYIFKQWNDFRSSEESDDEDDEVEDTLQAQFMFFLDHWFRQNDTLAMSDVVDMLKTSDWDPEELKLVLRSSEFRAKYMAHATRDCIMLV